MGGHQLRSLFVVVLIWGVVSSVVFCADEVDPKRKELLDINTQLQQKRLELEKIKQKQDATLRNLAVINRQLKSTQHELVFTDTQLQNNQEKLQKSQQELNTLKENYIIERNRFEKRLRDIYKDNRLGYLAMLFSSETMGDFINRMLYVEKVLKADMAQIERLASKRQLIEMKERSLRMRSNELNDIRQLFQKRKQQFQTQQMVQNRLYRDIERKRREYERQIAELEKNSQEIENWIQRILSAGKGSTAKGTGKFGWPARGALTSGYGYRKHPIFRSIRFHSGIDIGVRYGTGIAASDSGKVIFTGWWGGYGMVTIIDHGNGYSTVYAHQSKFYVSKDQYVKKGQIIGAVGSTGYSTGPHVHFEIRHNGATVNPLRFL